MTKKYRTSTLPLVISSIVLLSGCAGTPHHSVHKQGASRANSQLAGDYLRRGDLNQATRFFKKSLKFKHHNVGALWGLAITNSRKGNTKRARHYYKKAMAVHSKPALVNSYAAFLCQHGKPQKAIQLFKQAANDAHYDHPGKALANAGLCLAKQGHTGRSRHLYQKALRKNQNQPMALTQMARMDLNKGDAAKAFSYAQRIVQHDALNPGQMKLIARIDRAAGHHQKAVKMVKLFNQRNHGHLSMKKLGRMTPNQSTGS